MNEKDLGNALLKWHAGQESLQVDPQKLVASVLERDRRRVRWLTAGTIVLWTIAALGIPLFTAIFVEFVLPRYNWVMQEMITHQEGADPKDMLNASNKIMFVTAKLGISLVCGSVGALLLAAGAPIWLVFATRRATLREVNANLAAISGQWKRLGPAVA